LEDELGAGVGDESKTAEGASLFSNQPLPEHEQMVLERLKHDESTQLDELIERLEAELGSAEIFTALFELELAGRVRQLPGKNYVRSF
jgi:DNA processing protein